MPCERYGVNVPTATASRHAAATAVTKGGEERERAAVATMMSHSLQTQDRYYAELKGREEAVKGFQNLRQGSAPTHRGRVPFSEEEIQSLTLFFEEYIETDTVPAVAVCRDFLKNHPLDRQPKQICDKLRHLINVRKGETN